MLEFLEISFPNDISYGSTGGTEYLTSIVLSSNGREQRHSKWQKPRRKYNVIHGVRTAAQMQELITFFHICQGRAKAFRFKDWSDYQASKQPLLPHVGSPKQLQLCKIYSLGEESAVRKITKPVKGTFALYYKDKVLLAGQDYQLDYSTGIITLNIASMEVGQLQADFEFDVPVRFDSDVLEASLDAQGIHSCKAISLLEVKYE